MEDDILSFGDNSPPGVPSHLAGVKRSRKRTHKPAFSATEAEANVTRARCLEAIELVLGDQRLPESYETYYRGVEALCRLRHSERSELGDRLTSKVTEHFHDVVEKRVTALLEARERGDDFPAVARAFLDVFVLWRRQLRVLSILFLYLDRTYLLNHPTKKSVTRLGADLFVALLVPEDSAVRLLVLETYVALLDQRRQDEQVRELTATFSSMIFWLNTNNRLLLHNMLVDALASQYAALKTKWLRVPEFYFEHALRSLAKEMAHFKDAGAPQSFLLALVLRLKWVLIFGDFSLILTATLHFLLAPKYRHQLLALYGFCLTTQEDWQFNSLRMLQFHWANHIVALVAAELELATKGPDWILEVVKQYNNYDDIRQKQFRGSKSFEFVLRNSFSKAFNEQLANMRIMSHLSKFCDSFLREWSKRAKKPATSELFVEFQKKVLLVFKLINNKDSFMVLYKRDLSKRLLTGRAPNMEAESAMVKMFVKEIGDSDLSKELETMFSDMALAEAESLAIEGVEFCPVLLSKLAWPEVPGSVTDIILPAQLGRILDSYSSTYHKSSERYKDRALDWSHFALHQMEITAHFDGGVKELAVNALQATVILLFNDKDSLTVHELVAATGMEEKLVRRVLSSLTEKYSILVAADGRYAFNSGFTDKNSRLKIPFLREKESAAMDQTALKTIERNRTQEIRAAIVRTMKAAKQCTIPELFDLVFKLVSKKGPVSLEDVNSNLDYLVQSQYVARETGKVVYVP